MNCAHRIIFSAVLIASPFVLPWNYVYLLFWNTTRISRTSTKSIETNWSSQKPECSSFIRAYHSRGNEYTISEDNCFIREYCRLRIARSHTNRKTRSSGWMIYVSSSQTVSVSIAMLSKPRIGAYSSVHIKFVKTTTATNNKLATRKLSHHEGYHQHSHKHKLARRMWS